MICLASIPSKSTVPSDITMSNAADIKVIQDEIIKLYQLVNDLIDVVTEQNKKLNKAVYYQDD